MRKFHQLRVDDRLKYPLDCIFTDTETTTLKDDEDFHEPVLKIGVACYTRLNTDISVISDEWFNYSKHTDFWLWVDDIVNETGKVTIYAHNWNFDFPVLKGFKTLESMGYELKTIVDQGPPIILRYKHEKGKIDIIDSMNYYQQKLEDMGKTLGVEKIDVDFETCTDNELKIYCRQDVKILRGAMINLMKYLHVNNLSRLTHTVSSIAFTAFCRRFKPVDIFIDGNEKRVSVTRESYFGGRSECFRVGKYKSKLRLIDVNSQYPFVMRNNKFPVKTFAMYKNVDHNELSNLILKYCVTAKCRINTEIPCFPVKIGGRTCFPVGSYETTLSTPEIEYGLNNDLIESCSIAVLHYGYAVFTKYVDFFYNERNRHRSSGNMSWSELSKKLMNTLYGKFGQSGHEWVKTNRECLGYPRRWTEIDLDVMKRVNYMEIGGCVYESKKENESRDSYPAIAAHVTAYGRMLIQYMLDYLGREHVYYCDTDSLLIDEHAFDRVKDKLSPSILGCWSLDGEYDQIEIRGPKDYVFGEKEKIKGVKRDHVVVEKNLYRMLQFSNLKGLIRSNHVDAPIIRHVNKRLERIYRKGVVRSDGVVEPFRLADGVLISENDAL